MKSLKQSFFTLAFALIALATNAQDNFTAKTKGSFLANGSISFNTTSSKQTFGASSVIGGPDSKTTSSGLSAGPKVGYYIMDNLAIGIDLEITSTTEKDGDEKSNVTGLGFGPFARYHLDNGLFGEVSGFFGSTKVTASAPGIEVEQKLNSFGFRVGAGYSFFLGDHVAIEPALFYVYQSSEPKDATIDLKTTLSTVFLNIGFTAYF